MPPWLVPLPPPPTTPPYTHITTRNLLYHAYCPRGIEATAANLYQIKKRLPLFNGRRIVAVPVAPDLYSPRTIQRFLGPRIEIITIPNDPRLRDSATFHALLSAIQSTNDTEATFYAHTKGTSPRYPGHPADARAIRDWRNAAYHYLLDNWRRVAAALRTYATCGTHLIDHSLALDPIMRSPTGLKYGSWHYAGTFFWFRHDHVFRRPEWPAVPADPWANEMWLGHLLPVTAAKTLYQPWPATADPAPNPYLAALHPRHFPDPRGVLSLLRH